MGMSKPKAQASRADGQKPEARLRRVIRIEDLPRLETVPISEIPQITRDQMRCYLRHYGIGSKSEKAKMDEQMVELARNLRNGTIPIREVATSNSPVDVIDPRELRTESSPYGAESSQPPKLVPFRITVPTAPADQPKGSPIVSSRTTTPEPLLPCAGCANKAKRECQHTRCRTCCAKLDLPCSGHNFAGNERDGTKSGESSGILGSGRPAGATTSFSSLGYAGSVPHEKHASLVPLDLAMSSDQTLAQVLNARGSSEEISYFKCPSCGENISGVHSSQLEAHLFKCNREMFEKMNKDRPTNITPLFKRAVKSDDLDDDDKLRVYSRSAASTHHKRNRKLAQEIFGTGSTETVASSVPETGGDFARLEAKRVKTESDLVDLMRMEDAEVQMVNESFERFRADMSDATKTSTLTEVGKLSSDYQKRSGVVFKDAHPPLVECMVTDGDSQSGFDISPTISIDSPLTFPMQFALEDTAVDSWGTGRVRSRAGTGVIE